jgi:hypothetical protein
MAWGEDGHTLYIAASASIYKIRINTTGVAAGR